MRLSLLFALSEGATIIGEVFFDSSRVSVSQASAATATITSSNPLIISYTKSDGSTGTALASSAEASSLDIGSGNDNDNNEAIIALAVCIPIGILLLLGAAFIYKREQNEERKKSGPADVPVKSVDDEVNQISVRKSTEVDGDGELSDEHISKIVAQPSRISVV